MLISSSATASPLRPVLKLEAINMNSTKGAGLPKRRFSQFNRKSRRRQLSTSQGSWDITPTPGTGVSEMYSGTSDYFRQRIDDVSVRDQAKTSTSPLTRDNEGTDQEVEVVVDIPDHLPNSPLCPKNAVLYGLSDMRDGRRLICPLHGDRSGVSSVDGLANGVREKETVSLMDMM